MRFILAFVLGCALGKRFLSPRPIKYTKPSDFVIDRINEAGIDSGILPKMIVFDLDHTLWTPELYTLRHIPESDRPVAGEDVWLLPDSYAVLHELATHPRWKDDVQIGIASRTSSVSFAHHLLNTIEIDDGRSIASLVEPGCTQIFSGNKKKHFERLVKASGYDYSDMIFFDDARDGKYGNCEPVAALGTMSCHCPRGLTLDIFEHGLKQYAELRPAGKQGRIVDAPRASGDNVDTKRMKVFSMNQPFASLLAHGVKRLETRNGTMFANAKPGDKMLLHVGQRQYPDGGEHRVILQEAGYSPVEIDRLTSLPKGFQKGQIVAMLELGSTVLVENEKMRSNSSIERAVVARGRAMGKHLTVIKSVKWLKKGIKTKGNPGIFSVDVPSWLLPDLNTVAIPEDYTWEGGGGTDVCASALNDDPFGEAAEEGEDPWESFKERVAKSIDSDPSWNKERRGSGRWP